VSEPAARPPDTRPAENPRRTRRRRPRVSLSLGLGLVGTVLTVVSVGFELTDAQPRAQLWVGTAAGAVFLLAVPFVRGSETSILIGRARLLAGAGVAAVLAVVGLWQAMERDDQRVLLLLLPALLLFVTASLAVREAGRSRTTIRAGQLRARLEGEEAERHRWAQELHDQTLQDLAAIEVRLAGLSRMWAADDPKAMATGLEDTRVMVREQIRSLRHLITQMRPLALDMLGLQAAVQDLARRAEDLGGIPVDVDLAELPAGITSGAEVSIYRIVQEAVTNALRHAACHHIEIVARRRGNTVLLTIQDDGIGLQTPDRPAGPSPESYGRLGMSERADALHARLTWASPPEGGTRVTLAADIDRLTRGKPPMGLRPGRIPPIRGQYPEEI
jgi:signal transduction histidine kinase